MENKNIYIGIGGLFIIVIVLAYFLLDFKNQPAEPTRNPNQPAAGATAPADRNYQYEVVGDNKPVTAIVAKVARHIILPQGKVTVATVKDAAGLRQENPQFFQFANNGDKVLIYDDRQILYDPKADIIVNIQFATKK